MEKKVTKAALECMRMGETRKFQLPDAAACHSGKSLASHYQKIFGCRFTAETDFSTCELSITKLPS